MTIPPGEWRVQPERRGIIRVQAGAYSLSINALDQRVVFFGSSSQDPTVGSYAVRVAPRWASGEDARVYLVAFAKKLGAPDGWVVNRCGVRLDQVKAGRVVRGSAWLEFAEDVRGLRTYHGGNMMTLEVDPYSGELMSMGIRYLTTHEGIVPQITPDAARTKSNEDLLANIGRAHLASLPEVKSVELCYTLREKDTEVTLEGLDIRVKPAVARLAFLVTYEPVPDRRSAELTRNLYQCVDAATGEILYRHYSIYR